MENRKRPDSMVKQIKVVPNSSKNQVIESKDSELLIVRIREKPEKNKANQAIVKLLEKHFNKKVRIISGFKSRKKQVEIID